MSNGDSNKRGLNNLKHGVFAKAALLPGEDPAEFQVLCEGLFHELQPQGVLEVEEVLSIAKHVWRKRRLFALRTAKVIPFNPERDFSKGAHVELRLWEIGSGHEKSPTGSPTTDRAFLAREAAERARKAHEEKISEAQNQPIDIATFEKDLELEAKVDVMIERGLKRLMQIKAMKDMIDFRSNRQAAQPAIAGPKSAANDAVDHAEPHALASKE